MSRFYEKMNQISMKFNVLVILGALSLTSCFRAPSHLNRRLRQPFGDRSAWLCEQISPQKNAKYLSKSFK